MCMVPLFYCVSCALEADVLYRMWLLVWLLCACALVQKFQAVSAAYTRLVASEETDDTISTVSYQ